MKRIISILTVVMLVVSMFSITAMAADPKAMTIALSTDKANFGEEFTVNAVLASTVEVKDMQVYIEYDPADFELGTSDAADELIQSFYDEYIGEGKDYATMEDFLVDMGYDSIDACVKDQIGVSSYVDTTYYDAYSALKDTKKWGSPAIGAEQVKDGMMNVMFSYMKTGAISKLNNTNNLSVGGAVLKVATTEKKQATISVKKTFTTYDTSGTKLYVVADDVVVNLNGYDPNPGPVVITAEQIGLKTDDSQILRLKDVKVNNNNGESYTVKTALGFVSCVNADVDADDLYTEINLEGWTGKPLEIAAKNTTPVGDQVYFVAAVTSIRKDNLSKAFTAKAYATVGGQLVDDSNTVSAAYEQ